MAKIDFFFLGVLGLKFDSYLCVKFYFFYKKSLIFLSK